MPFAPTLSPIHSPISQMPASAPPARAPDAGRLPRRAHARGRQRADDRRDDGPVEEVDQVIHVCAAVHAGRVAACVDEQRDRDRQVERARIRLLAAPQAPCNRGHQQPARVADRPKPHALAVIARRIRVEECVRGEGDDGALQRSDRCGPGKVRGRRRRCGRRRRRRRRRRRFGVFGCGHQLGVHAAMVTHPPCMGLVVASGHVPAGSRTLHGRRSSGAPR